MCVAHWWGIASVPEWSPIALAFPLTTVLVQMVNTLHTLHSFF